MLLKTIARKTLKLKNHKIDKVEQDQDGTIRIYLRRKIGRRLESKCCETKSRVVDYLPRRTWKHVSIWGIKIEIVYAPARVKCTDCGKLTVEKVPWSLGKCRLTVQLISHLTLFAELLPWKQVATLFGVHY